MGRGRAAATRTWWSDMVKVNAERIPNSQMLLNIEVEPERIEKSVEKAYRRLVTQINIPGFRRGKAPRSVVERFIGRESLRQEGLEVLLNDVYREAVEELGLHPIDQPEIDIEPKASELKPGDTLHIKATVPIRPEVEIGDYRAIRLTPVDISVTGEDVDRIIGRLQTQETHWVPVERPAAEGDSVVIDLVGEVNTFAQLYSSEGNPLVQSEGGRKIYDEQATEYIIAKESAALPPGVLEQIVGMNPGEEKHFEISLPADYADAELASKLAIFKVTLKELKEKQVPAIDDELAKVAGYESVEQLRLEVEKRATAQAESNARRIYEGTAVSEAVALATVELPPSLVEHEIEHQMEHTRDEFRQQQADLTEYLKRTNKSEADVREELRPQAIDNVKTTLVLQKIAELENVQVGEDEIDQQIELIAMLSGNQADRARQTMALPDRREALGLQIRRDKTIALLAEIARTGAAVAEPSVVEPSTVAAEAAEQAQETDAPPVEQEPAETVASTAEPGTAEAEQATE